MGDLTAFDTLLLRVELGSAALGGQPDRIALCTQNAAMDHPVFTVADDSSLSDSASKNDKTSQRQVF